jgi:hypothetical protein
MHKNGGMQSKAPATILTYDDLAKGRRLSQGDEVNRDGVDVHFSCAQVADVKRNLIV